MAFKKKQYVIGIDEVGRGPLAGPVVVSALMLKRNFQFPITNFQLPPLRDSKRLSAKQREIWFQYLKNHPQISYATARVYPRLIDKINIANAANRAATKAVQKLITHYPLLITHTKIFLDGGLYINKIPNSKFQIPHSRTIIRGDEKIPAISLASIVAKVARDRYMVKLHKRYPQYEFDRHKGYGTKRHIAAIKKYGLSEIHRLTFVKKFANISSKK